MFIRSPFFNPSRVYFHFSANKFDQVYSGKSILIVRLQILAMDARNIDSYYSKLHDAARHNFHECLVHTRLDGQ